MNEQIEIRDLRGRPFEKKSFYMVMPMWLWDSEDIPEKVKRLYALISSLASKEGFCWASNTFLANEIRVSERTIIRYIIALETKGLIRAERGENDRKIYMGSVSLVTGGSDNLKPSLSLGGDKTPPILSPNNIYIRNNTDTPKKAVSPDVSDSDISLVTVDESGEPVKKRENKLPQNKAYEAALAYMANKRSEITGQEFKFGGSRIGHYKALKDIKKLMSNERAYEIWEELCESAFWQDKGFDLWTIKSQFLKKGK